MSRRERLYDAPASKKARGEEVAKKGDVRKGKDLEMNDPDGDAEDEYESLGYLRDGNAQEHPDPAERADRSETVNAKARSQDKSHGGYEYWKRRKSAVPTS